MGKRSDFKRVEKDFYRTWDPRAYPPLLAQLPVGARFDEPCAGTFDLARHLVQAGHPCLWVSDIAHADSIDAMSLDTCRGDYFITNPPWTRSILHPLIAHLSRIAPTWLLFDADWIHTKQAAPYLPYCHRVVSVGRLRWIEGTSDDGKDNVAWYLFDQTAPRVTDGPVMIGRAA